MNAQNMVEALGWTLVHFVWQGVVAVVFLAILLRLLRTASSRYLAATSMMALLLAIATVTFFSKVDWQTGGEWSVQAPVVSADQAPALSDDPSLIREPASAVGMIGNAEAKSGDELARTIPPAGAITETRPASWLGWVVAGWLIGVAVFAVRFFFDWRAVVSLRKTGLLVDGDCGWSEQFAGLAKRIGIARSVELLSSAAVHVPLVLGVLRPVVIVPVAMLSSLPPAQVDALLLHELAHVRRHDFLINLLQSLVETLFFFHPAVWWISRKIREERENCCDDLAVSACGNDVRHYAGALAALEESRDFGAPSLSLAADGGHFAGGSLVSRIRRLVRRDGSSAPTSGAWPLASIAVLILALAGAFGVFFSITDRAAADDAAPDWERLRVSHFGDADREVFCIHTDETIETVVVISTPDEFRSARSKAVVRRVKKGGDRHLAYGNFGWDGLRLKIGFDSSRPGELQVNEQTVLLEYGRVVFWRSEEEWADQSNVVAADLPSPSQPESELGQALSRLRARIIDEFSPQDAENILAPREPGSWQLGEGLTLDLEQRKIDEADEKSALKTVAILRWQATENRPALRHEIEFDAGPWALALEKGGRTIWTAGDHDVFRQIDFSDPKRIQEDCMNSGFGDMPDGIRAELQREIRVDKKLDRRGLPNIGGNMGSHGEDSALIEDEFVVRGSVINEQPGWPDRDLPAAPFADVPVEAYTIASPNLPVAKTRSDADGNWELRFRVAADLFEKVSRRLEIRADVPGYAEQNLMVEGEMIMALPEEELEGVDDQAKILRTGEIGQATFRMLKAGKIRGVLRDGEDQPIADAFVWVKVDDNEEPRDDDWVARPGVTGDLTKSNAKGEFVLSRVPPNRELHIAASLPGGASVQTDAYMMGTDELTLNVKWDGDTLECAPGDTIHKSKPKQADAPEPEDKEGEPEVILTLNADGEVSLDGKPVSDDDLLAFLKELADGFPDHPVIIRAVRETEFGKVSELLDLVKVAGLWNVAFAAVRDKTDKTNKLGKKDIPLTVDGGHQNAWSAEGKVTDIHGRPMEGVEVTVYSGMGSLQRTGVAKSRADGSYRVTFSRGGLMSVDGPNLQVAQIGAHLPGYVEKNLNRHGNGAMAMGSEGGDSAIVQVDIDNDGELDLLLGKFEISAKDLNNFDVDADTLALPGRPRKLDFVMVPAVRIEGRLVGSGAFSGASPKIARTMNPDLPRGPYVDLDKSPLAGWKVWITGDELPPGSSVWDSAVVDEDGRFVFENVPAGFEWYFRTETNIPGGKEPVSRKFTLARGEEVRTASVVLELKADQKKVNLELPK